MKLKWLRWKIVNFLVWVVRIFGLDEKSSSEDSIPVEENFTLPFKSVQQEAQDTIQWMLNIMSNPELILGTEEKLYEESNLPMQFGVQVDDYIYAEALEKAAKKRGYRLIFTDNPEDGITGKLLSLERL